MDIFLLQFLYALGAIVLIDLVLAGDNAIVIALAARKLPPDLRKRAILWGTAGAIIVRALMTGVVVWLLKVPGLMLAGGALLVWIAVKLLAPQDELDTSGHASADSFWGAMKTIVIADAVMGLDNVLAVAGAAHGSFLLVVLGRRSDNERGNKLVVAERIQCGVSEMGFLGGSLNFLFLLRVLQRCRACHLGDLEVVQRQKFLSINRPVLFRSIARAHFTLSALFHKGY